MRIWKAMYMLIPYASRWANGTVGAWTHVGEKPAICLPGPSPMLGYDLVWSPAAPQLWRFEMNCRESVKEAVKECWVGKPTGEFYVPGITDCTMTTGLVPHETMQKMRDCGLLKKVGPNREKLTPEGMLYLKEAINLEEG